MMIQRLFSVVVLVRRGAVETERDLIKIISLRIDYPQIEGPWVVR